MSVDLIRLYQDKLDVVLERLENYVATPDAAAVHTVRTSIRRLEVAYKALPDSCRNKSLKSYHRSIKEFFSRNSEIRDCDVMLEKLTAYGLAPDSPLPSKLAQSRNKQVNLALDLGAKLLAMKSPALTTTSDDPNTSLGQLLQELLDSFLGFIPLVLEDEAAIEDVHSLRKDAKKLFYLFELDPARASMQQAVYIRSVQKLTGDIHDCDVITAFLTAHQTSAEEAPAILAREKELRHNYYRQLCGLLNDPQCAMLRHLA